jgi:DNA polymerase
MTTLAIDYETDYSRDYSVAEMGVWAYVNDVRFRAHTVSMAGSDGFEWVGRPVDAPWEKAHTYPLWISHNAAFDEAVHTASQIRQVCQAPVLPAAWDCTADMMSYLQHPRSLKEACRVGLGVNVDKSIREDLAGDTLFTPSDADVRAYALEDARLCLRLWQKFSARWPEHEREVSRHTRLMARRGVGFDHAGAVAAGEKLRKKLKAVEAKIPWAAAGKPPTSRNELLAEVARLGLPAPTTTAEKSEEWQAWLDAHEKDAPWVRALNQWRKINRTLSVVESMVSRSDGQRLHAPLKYYGAAVTGRWSGSDGLNMQNLNSKETAGGVDLRALLRPESGKVFVVCDLSQIEPRVLAVLAGDEAMLAGLRSGLALYEAHARATMMWGGGALKKENPRLYALAKARVLGLGYGAGPETFRRVAKIMAGLELDETDATTFVEEFRKTNPRTVELWGRMQKAFNRTDRDVVVFKTKAGRALRYFGVDGKQAEAVKGSGKRLRWWGSKLVENLVQGTARDVLAGMVLEIERAGLPVVLHVHDEVVVEVASEDAEAALETVDRIMSTAPEWMPDLPVECEGSIMEVYGK